MLLNMPFCIALLIALPTPGARASRVLRLSGCTDF